MTNYLKANFILKKTLFAIAFLNFYTVFSQKETKNPAFTTMLNELLSHSVNEIHPNEIENFNDHIFLDAREHNEYKVSHIKGAKWVGYENFNKKKLDVFDKNKPIIVYCTVGYRSEKIAEKLIKMGYLNVFNLYGGIFEWFHSNKKVFNSASETQKIHTYNEDWSKWLLKGEKVY